MADESIIADLKSQGFDKLIQDLSLSAKGFSELEKTMSEAQKKLDTLDKSSQEFKDLAKEINAAAIATKAYSESNDSLKRELTDTNNEIGKLQRSLNALEKAGETNTQTYKDLVASQDALKKKSGELTNTVRDLNQEIKNSGSDTRNLDKAVRAISTVASGYQVAQGALALYGGENKKFEQALLKLNAVMAITQGLQQIQGELSKRDSVFTQAAAKAKLLYASALNYVTNGITTSSKAVVKSAKSHTDLGDAVKSASTGTTLLTTAQKAHETATKASTVATAANTTSIAASSLALQVFRFALLATGIGAFVVGLGYLISNWSELKAKIFETSISLKDYNSKQEKTLELEEKIKNIRLLSNNLAVLTGAKTERQAERDAVVGLVDDYNKLDNEYIKQSKRLKELKSSFKGGYFKNLFGQSRDEAINEQEEILSQVIIKRAEALEKALTAGKVFNDKITKEEEDAAKAEKERLKRILEEKLALQKKYHDYLEQLQKARQKRLDDLAKQAAADEKKKLEEALKLKEQLRKDGNEKDAKQQKEARDRFENSQENILKTEQAFNEKRNNENELRRKRQEDAEKEHIEKIGNLIGGLTDVANRIGNLASQAIEVRSQNEIRALDQRKQQGLISEKQYQKEMAKIKNEAARKQRTADIAMAFAMIPQAAFSAFTSTPGGIVVKSIAAALASAFGLAQVALIASAPLPQFRDGGQVSKKLGLIKGARHERGGVPIEVEGEEYVMPVEQTKENLPALEAMRKGKFNELFIPKQNVMQPDVFANIPNPSNIALPVANEMNDYSSINKRLDKLASEMWWLGQYTKEGNKVRERGTEKIVKNLETQRKRYV